ncbi:MAG: hypothetical protein U0446_11750 [Dehalococcoidia bacterium]
MTTATDRARMAELRREIDVLLGHGYRYGSRDVRARVRELDALEAAQAADERAAARARRTPAEIVDATMGIRRR